MRYSRSILKEHFNIVDYISRYVTLKKSGKNYVGLCPFHQEKTPSFSVSEEKQIFHCFGCGVGGDLVSFLENYLKLDRYEVLLMLEREKGIKLIEKNDEFEKKSKQIAKILSINKVAVQFFVDNLFKTVEGGKVLRYLNKRGISIDIIKTFSLGFGGSGFDQLYKELVRRGYSREDIEKTGLVAFSKNGAKDFFRNRLIFPIFSYGNDVVAFGGRALDSSLPKYINSSEGLVFSKRKNLYGINIAKEKILEENKVFIVEGYIDCLSMHQVGYASTVATLGTAITEEQIKFLKGFTETFYLVYDGDEAGIKAALRAVEIFLNFGITPYIVSLPPGEDPDSLIVKGKKDVLDECINKAKKGIDFLIDFYQNKYPLNSTDGLRSFVYSIGTHVQKIKNPIEKELLLREVSRVSGISLESFYQQFEKVSPLVEREEKKDLISNGEAVFENILAMLLQKPSLVTYINKEMFEVFPAEYKEIVEKLILKNDEDLSERAKNLYTRLSIKDFPPEFMTDEHFLEMITFLERKQIKERKEKIDELIRIEEAKDNPDYNKILSLQEEKKRLVIYEKKLLKKE